jgi:hypothetical protein
MTGGLVLPTGIHVVRVGVTAHMSDSTVVADLIERHEHSRNLDPNGAREGKA